MPKNKKEIFASALVASFVFLSLATTPAIAQVTTGSILGTIHDSTGAVVPNATVTITDTAKGTISTKQTDASGDYNVPFLIPGTYTVSVEMPGFKRSVSSNVVLDIDQKARVDFDLEAGGATETVQVNTAPPLLRLDSSELGEVVGKQQVQNLPLNGRNFASLVYLVPGVTAGQAGENLSGSSSFNPRAASNFNALGSQANANAWLVDGIIDNEYTFNTVMVQPSVESIQEFKVLTGTFSAEYGRGAGVVSTQTKSGQNELHGSAFEFLRNDYFDARNYFNRAGTPVPPYRRNQYGASVGGPIWKNHTFFFADYYGQREIKGQTFINTVPTAQERTGDFSDITGAILYNPFTTRLNPSYNPNLPTTAITGNNPRILRDPFAGNRIPSNLLNSVGLNVASLYPLPNVPGAPFANNRIDVFSRDLKDNGGNIRIDHRLSDKDSLFGRFSFEQFILFDTRGQGGCCIPTPSDVRAKFALGPFIAGGQNTNLAASGFAFNETHVFSPTVVNQFIAGFSRTNPFTTQSDFGLNAATSLGIQGINVTQ